MDIILYIASYVSDTVGTFVLNTLIGTVLFVIHSLWWRNKLAMVLYLVGPLIIKKLGRVSRQIHFMWHELARVSLQEGQRFSAALEKDSLISKATNARTGILRTVS